jgi:pimeloyl-ACP methyl ester carboxylesterase
VILEQVQVRQRIDRAVDALFDKQRIVTRSPQPLNLVRKRLAGSDRCSATVLLVHGFGQNRYTWHLPSRSFANYLAANGMDVFNVDLRGHGRSRVAGAGSVNSINEYVREDLPAAIDAVVRHSGKRQVFIVGHSLGGLVAYAGASAIRPSVAGIVSIGSPYHFARGSASLNGLARLSHALGHFEPAREWGRRTLLPMRAIGAMLRHGRRLAESSLYPLPIRAWHPGTCEPHIIEEHLRLAFDRVSFAEGVHLLEWARDKRFGGDRHRYDETFESLDVPLLVIAGSRDDLAKLEGVKPGYEKSGSRDKTFATFPLGHIDLIMGRDAHVMTWPAVRRWIAARA